MTCSSIYKFFHVVDQTGINFRFSCGLVGLGIATKRGPQASIGTTCSIIAQLLYKAYTPSEEKQPKKNFSRLTFIRNGILSLAVTAYIFNLIFPNVKNKTPIFSSLATPEKLSFLGQALIASTINSLSWQITHGVNEIKQTNLFKINSTYSKNFKLKDLSNCLFAQLLILLGANVNHEDLYKQTPLIKNCIEPLSSGHLNMVKVLVYNGANINQIDTFGATPIYYAKDKPEILKFLLERGANISNLPPGENFLHSMCVCATVSKDCLKLVLDHGADLNYVYRSDRSLLFVTWRDRYIRFGQIILTNEGFLEKILDKIKILLDYGAEVNEKLLADPHFYSFYHHYQKKREIKFIQELHPLFNELQLTKNLNYFL